MDTEKLAELIGVTVSDIDSLMRMVCESLKRDGMSDIVVNANVDERVDIVNAYVNAEAIKFSEFCVTLLTNKEKRNAFDLYLFNQFSD